MLWAELRRTNGKPWALKRLNVGNYALVLKISEESKKNTALLVMHIETKYFAKKAKEEEDC